METMKSKTQTITLDLLARLSEGAREQAVRSGGKRQRASATQRRRQHGENRQVRVQPNPVQPTDAER